MPHCAYLVPWAHYKHRSHQIFMQLLGIAITVELSAVCTFQASGSLEHQGVSNLLTCLSNALVCTKYPQGQPATVTISTAKALVHQLIHVFIIHGHVVESKRPINISGYHAWLPLQPGTWNRPPTRESQQCTSPGRCWNSNPSLHVKQSWPVCRSLHQRLGSAFFACEFIKDLLPMAIPIACYSAPVDAPLFEAS